MNSELDIKAIPKLRFSKFKDPWGFSKIEDLFDFKNGLNKEKEFFGSGTPIINFMDVYKLTSIREKDISGLVKLTDSEINRFSAYKGDVFFTRTSETIHDIGMSATLVEPIENCVFSGFVLRARPKTRLFSENFTGYLFSTQPVRKEITTKSSMTTRALTSGTLLNKVSFYYPGYKEQNKIAEFLSSVDKKIQLLEKKKELLEEYKKGVMQKIFSREIRFKDDNGNSYPDWEEKKLGEIAKIYQPKTISQADLTNDGYVVYGANGIIGNYHSFNHELSQVVVTCRGSSCGTVNLTNPFSWITGNAMVINLDNSAYMNKTFLFFQLYNTDFNYLITGSGQPQITSDIKSHKVVVPSFDEQKKIANFLSAIDKKIETTSIQIDKTKEFKKGLLQQMFV